jgi:anti-sigma B factor antagonist
VSTKTPSLRVSVEYDRAVVAAPAILDLYTAPRLREDIAQALADSPSGDIVLAVGAVEFCDSTGLGVLLGAVKRTHERGGKTYLARTPMRVFELLWRTGTLGLFELIEDIGELAPPGDEGGLRGV